MSIFPFIDASGVTDTKKVTDLPLLKEYVYYTGSNERYEQTLNEKIRADVLKISSEIMQYIKNPSTIRPELRRRCNGCSMKELCAPKRILVKEYMEHLMAKYVNDEE